MTDMYSSKEIDRLKEFFKENGLTLPEKLAVNKNNVLTYFNEDIQNWMYFTPSEKEETIFEKWEEAK
jgi:hypothetical protein